MKRHHPTSYDVLSVLILWCAVPK